MYAIISDVHGNYPALNAVLSDAKKQGAEHLLFLGDYTNSFPFQNEVAEALRHLPDITAIRGNHENYLIDIHALIPSERIVMDFMPLYWSYDCHTPENFKFITNLPETAVISSEGGDIHLAHKVQQYIPSSTLFLDSIGYTDLRRKSLFTFEEYLKLMKEWLLNSPEIIEALRALPIGVYLFGHSHIPLHVEFEGRYLINPGSCGFTCDHDTRAAYALLEWSAFCDGGYSWRSWHVTQRHVEYNINEVTEAIYKSGFKEKFPEWHEVFLKQLLRGDDTFSRYMYDRHSG